jgi:hypothetical protein
MRHWALSKITHKTFNRPEFLANIVGELVANKVSQPKCGTITVKLNGPHLCTMADGWTGATKSDLLTVELLPGRQGWTQIPGNDEKVLADEKAAQDALDAAIASLPPLLYYSPTDHHVMDEKGLANRLKYASSYFNLDVAKMTKSQQLSKSEVRVFSPELDLIYSRCCMKKEALSVVKAVPLAEGVSPDTALKFMGH